MKITINFTARKKPATGDQRVSKKHGLQIRIPSMVHGPRGEPIGFDCSGGRQRYEWRKPDELVGTRWEYLLKNLKGGEA